MVAYRRVEHERDLVAELEARAARECPDLTVDATAWRAHLVACLGDGTGETLHAGDLLLAFACASRDAAALRTFEQRYAAMLRDAVRAVDGDADDVVQELRRRLLITDPEAGVDARPRILAYRGTGPLGGWLRVAGLRLAIDLRRGTWREIPVEDALVPASSSVDGSFAHDRDRSVVRDALRAAIVAQSSRTRTLLRYYYCESVGVEELGAIYNVHASTVSRWLTRARDDVFEETRRRLAAALRAAPSDVESHLGLAHGLDVSLGSLLRTPGGPTGA